LVGRFISFYHGKLFNPHWGENVHFQADNTLEISMACEGLDSLEVAETWRPFFDWVKARPTDFTVTDPLWANAWDARSRWDPSARSYNRDLRDGAPKHHVWNKSNTDECGAFLYGYDSLWLPASLLEKSRQNQLTEALFAASRHEMVRFHINKGMAGAPPEVLASVSQTATNPTLLDAFTLVIVADGDWTPAYPGFPRPPMDMAKARERARGIAMAAAELRKIAPHSGSYFNEGNFQRLVAGGVLGQELFQAESHQDEIRPGRALLRPPRCRQRGVERGRLYAPLSIGVSGGPLTPSLL